MLTEQPTGFTLSLTALAALRADRAGPGEIVGLNKRLLSPHDHTLKGEVL